MATLGSLFDGSGGFPLAASLCGIEPVWASEIEPYPIAVTRSRFQKMKHLGDVSKINGADIEPVDIVTFGSPCTDMSVAGRRAGLDGQQSILFYQAIRIIKEMREATNGEYPTFAVWENVPGAFSSNKGEDFRTVLEELIKIVEPTAIMPAVPKNGWPYADIYMGDGWSLAYRVFDAQYWGVPQRRRRIYLVADFRGQRAGEILFEREGVRGDFATCKTAGQGASGDAADRTGTDDCEGEGKCLTPWDYQGKRVYSADSVFPTLYSAENSGQQQQAVCLLTYDARGNGDGQTVSTLTGDHENRITDYSSVVVEKNPVYCLQGNGIDRADTAGCNGKGWKEDASYTLNTIDRPAVVYTTQAFGDYKDRGVCSGLKARDCKDATDLVVESSGIDCRNFTEYPELYPTRQAKPNGGQSLNFSGTVRVRYIVRRLTPTECARLQGFPDDWGHPDHKEDFTDEEYRFWMDVRNTHADVNGKPKKDYTKAQMITWYNRLHTDSSEYKMWGNGIAMPCALYCMQGIAEAIRQR